MTHGEHIAHLHKDVLEKLGKHFKAQGELALEGGTFIDKSHFDKVEKAYIEWQTAQAKHSSYLSFILRNRLNFNDKIED